ncbi:MAG TPA: hypothetical protein VFB36_02750 [Nevskiaceae bacterium]|nr:hypothetical protein [Nevskiaceae bacterium]
MQIKQPSLCARCVALFTSQVECDVSSCRVETWWCPHSAALAICVVNGAQMSQITIQGPLTDSEAHERIREFAEGCPIANESSGSSLRQ